MESPTIPQLVARLSSAFPRQEVTEATVREYVAGLGDLPPGLVEAAVVELTRTSRFFPTIAEVREAAAERDLRLPTEAEALAQVADRQAWARLDEGERPAPPDLHPLVRDAVAHVGGWHAFRSARRADAVRDQFLRLYRELRAGAVREYQVGRELAPGAARPELTA